MNRTILSSVFALCATTAIASAQQSPAPTPNPSTSPVTSQRTDVPPAQRAADSPDKVTFEGCLSRGMAAASATPGAVGTSGTGSFVLSKSKDSKDSTGATTNEAYRLEGDDAKLAPHVGHKIEVVGFMTDHSNTDTTSGNVAKTSGNTSSVKVESVRMLAATCTP